MTPDLSRAEWRSSTKSQDNGGCVEVAEFSGGIAIRNSKDPDGGVLIFSLEQWTGFLVRVAHGEYASGDEFQVEFSDQADRVAVSRTVHPSAPVLSFTSFEWTCFVDGVSKGEFGRVPEGLGGAAGLAG